MKKITSHFFLIACFFTPYIAFAQPAPPNGINYQAVARDAAGNPLVSTTVTVDFIIHINNPGGGTVYSETQTQTTNQFGLFTLVIGAVDPATFSAIPWSADKFYLEVVVNGNPMGTMQFLSVPYAFHSSTADSITTPPPFIWKKTGPNVFLNTISDSVGIGTSFPTAKLHVFDMSPNILLEDMGGAFNVGYKIKTGSGNTWLLGKENGEADVFKIKWNNTSGGNFTGFSMLSSGRVGIGTNAPLQFFHIKPDKDGNLDSSFVVDIEGRTGIGTGAPSEHLHIVGKPNSFERIKVESPGNTGDAGLNFQTDGNGLNNLRIIKAASLFSGTVAGVPMGNLSMILAGVNAGGLMLNTGSSSPLYFVTNNLERMRIDGAGNVGIGTTAPTNKVHIVGTPNTDILNVSDGTASAAVYVNNGSALAPVQFGSLTNHGIGFFTNNGVGAPAMVIKTSGNVGIGTTTPKNKLKIAGSFAAGYTAVNSTSYTATSNDCIINFTTGGALTLTLPLASSVDAGSILIVQFAAVSITINRQGGDLICTVGGSCTSLPQSYSSAVRFFSDGSGKWYEW